MQASKTSVEIAVDRSKGMGPIYDLTRWPRPLREAWAAMGSQCCAGCGWPMIPARKGGDEPGYCGFEPCPCGKGNVMPRPRRPDLATDEPFDAIE